MDCPPPETTVTTTDEDALLAAIAAAPRDDAPRLVYADWLQDHLQDAKADYVRAVVALLHDPADEAAVERCTALSQELDAGWRRQVGGRFEVVVEGSGAMAFLAHMFVALFKLPFREPIDLFQPGQPVRLQTGLTREDAERVARPFGAILPEQNADHDPAFRVFVRAMADDTTLSLFAPPPPG
jgi:uncharacterized protein (TIGR02996 family)